MLNIFLSLTILLLSQNIFGMLSLRQIQAVERQLEERPLKEQEEREKKIRADLQNKQNFSRKDTSIPQNPSLKRSTEKANDNK